MSQYTYRSSNTVSFSVKNVSNKKIRIFNYPLWPGETRDLMKIPTIGESDIRDSLVKGQLYHFLAGGVITIVSSDIDLIQFNTSQQTFLQNGGANVGTTTTIQVAPLGNNQDDAPNLSAAYNAGSSTGRPVTLLPGAYLWKSIHQLPATNLTIIASPGVTIQSTLPADGLESNAPFNYNANPTNAAATLTVQPAKGATTISVTDASSPLLAPGLFFRIQAPVDGGLLRLATYKVISRNIGANTITVDRPIVRTFPTSSFVIPIVPIQNFRLYGNGMRIIGTGDRGIEIVGGWECYISDVEIDGTGFQDFVCGYDLGSTKCVFENIKVDCHNFGYACVAFENSEQCTLKNAILKNAAGQGSILLPGAVDILIENVHSTGGTNGLYLAVNDVSNTEGCSGVRVVGCSFNGSTGDGIAITEGATDIQIVNCETNYNAINGVHITNGSNSTAPQRISITNLTAIGNAYGLRQDSATFDTQCKNIFCVDNTETQVLVNGGGSLFISGGLAQDHGKMHAFATLFNCSGSGSKMYVGDLHAQETSSINIQVIQVDTGAFATMKDCQIDGPSGTGVLFQVTGTSELFLSGNLQTTGGVYGVLLGGVADKVHLDGRITMPNVAGGVVLNGVTTSLADAVSPPGINLIALADSDTTLTWAQWFAGVLKFSGTLNATRTIKMQAVKVKIRVVNTTGQTLTFRAHDGLGTLIGTGTNVVAGASADVCFDGTNMVTV